MDDFIGIRNMDGLTQMAGFWSRLPDPVRYLLTVLVSATGAALLLLYRKALSALLCRMGRGLADLAYRLWADRRFEAQYLRLMTRWWEQPAGAGVLPSPTGRSFPLQDLFVAPSVRVWRWSEDIAAKESAPRSEPRHTGRPPVGERGWVLVPFAEAFSRHRHILLLGGPGSGKSTLLRFLALAHAQARLGQGEDLWRRLNLPSDRSFPILLPMRELIGQESSPLEQIEAFVSQHLGRGNKPPDGFFHRRLKRGGCILLLDGLDEVTGLGAEERERAYGAIRTLLALYPKNRISVTGRSGGWRGGLPPDLAMVSLAEFDRSQREAFICNWYQVVTGTDALAEELIEVVETSDPLRQIASTPLLLALLVWMYSEGIPSVSRRALLYDRWVEWMLARWDTERGVEDYVQNELSPKDRKKVLSRLAWHLQERGISRPDRVVVERLVSKALSELGKGGMNATEIVEWLERRTGLLVGGEKLTFVHHAFQEYFAAQMLVDDPEKRLWLLEGNPPRSLHPWWQEVARLYCGLAEDATEFIRALYAPEKDDWLRRRLFLAGRCIAEATNINPALQREIRGRLLWLWQEGPYRKWQEEAITVLSMDPDKETVRYFVKALTNDEPKMRWRAAEALGRLRQIDEEVVEEVVTALRKALHDENALVRANAATALGELDVPVEAVLSVLSQAMQDDDSLVRAGALEALMGRLGKEDLLFLLERASYEGALWRGKTAEALGILGGREEIDALRPMLNDPNPWVRLKATGALIRLGEETEEAVEVLKTYLIGQSWAGREAAATLTSMLSDGGERIVTWLIQISHSADPEMRGNALGALGLIGRTDRGVITALRRGVADGEAWEVRWKAAWSLGMLGRADPTVVDVLLSALVDDKEWITQWKAAEALGTLDRVPQEVIEALAQALSDQDVWVRDAALESLWRLSEQADVWLSPKELAPRDAREEESMTRIQVDPEQIRDLAYQMAQAGRQIAEVHSRLANGWTRLHAARWEGRHRTGVEGLWQKAQSQASMLADRATVLSRFLDERANAFQEAEHVSVAALSQVVAEIETLSAATRDWVSGLLQRFTSFPREAVERVLRLGEIFEHVNWSSLLGGLGLVSILKGLGVSNVPSPVSTPPTTSSSGFGQLLRPAEEGEETTTPPHSRFGELLREWEQEPPASPPSPPVSLAYDVPVLKQTARSFECGPTSVSMVLQYCNGEGTRPALTPQQIIQRLGHRFNPHEGIAADKLVDGLREMDLGYRTIEWTAGLGKEALLSELREGPVIAQVHLNLGPSGYPHMVVVTGASEGGNVIHINDPWTGKARQLTWEAFERTWTSSQCPQASHLIIRIRP
ncbi:MAG TPA: NACHT domain-containing protein [Anaerolineae bacterium]|nr:NACHT domain-containing protein [Anaerolineae bacterium]